MTALNLRLTSNKCPAAFGVWNAGEVRLNTMKLNSAGLTPAAPNTRSVADLLMYWSDICVSSSSKRTTFRNIWWLHEWKAGLCTDGRPIGVFQLLMSTFREQVGWWQISCFLFVFDGIRLFNENTRETRLLNFNEHVETWKPRLSRSLTKMIFFFPRQFKQPFNLFDDSF